MATQRSDLLGIYSFLKGLHFHYLETWVEECVNYYKSSNTNLSCDQLKNEVKQQWLLVNLKDLKVPALPPNLSKIEKTLLKGRYVVQVESMVDSASSMYSQLQKIRKVNIDNIQTTKETKDWEIKTSRCLVMTICDGVQELKAMEYQPLKSLRLHDPDLLPGFKMLIIGPVLCRKGMVMLREENIKVYGGEVDTMCESNSLESIICRNLNITLQENQQHGQPYQNNDITTPNVPRINNHEDYDHSALLSQNNDDDLLMNVDFEDDFSTNIINSQNNFNTVNDYTNENCYENVDFEIDIDEEISTRNNTMNHSGEHIPQNKNTIINNQPFVYIKQIENQSDGTYVIKGVILTLMTKVAIADDKFTLKAVITDGSASLIVNFSSDVLENILGFSPCEMIAMIKEKNRNSAIAERIKNAFQKTQVKLISLNCLMTISFLIETPCVVHLEEISECHLNALIARQIY